MNTLNLHNQPVEKEHVLPNLYDFGFHILIFQGVIKLLVVGLYALQKRSLAYDG